MGRKTYRSPSAVPLKLRRELSSGQTESATLGEGLAATLGVRCEIDPRLGITERIAMAAEALLTLLGDSAGHRSDTVRGWVAFRVGLALQRWVGGESYLRRFASEVTQPRGVWSDHIAALKARPAIALPVSDRCIGDESRYGREVCARWNVEYVTKRALRSVK